MNARRFLIVTALSLLAGCGGDKASGPTGLAGSLSFSYSGALSGTFNVTGQMPTTGQETSSWAAGGQDTGADQVTVVWGATPRSASSHDFVVVAANRITTGTSVIDYDNCTANNCSTVFFEFGVTNGSGSSWLQSCYLVSGSIVITEVSSSRIKGTFSGAGFCYTPGGTETAFTVTNGTFDVAIVPGVS